MAGRRLNLATLAGAAVESTPGSSKPTLVHVAPDQVAPTPLNPRQDFDPAKLEELGNSMRTGQLQPCVGITRARYIKLFPEHEEQLPDCRIVMAAGERRWKAAVHVGLPTLDVHVREDIAESRVRFLAAVLTENVERSNFNYIEEARGLQQMLEMTNGNQTQAAEKLQKSKQWFSQRIGLLRLSEEMQALVISGELKAFRDMRMYSAMPPNDQLAAWKADRMAAKQKADRKGPSTPAPSPVPVRETAAPAPKPEPTYTAVYTPPSSGAGSEQPVPRPEKPLSAESPGTVPLEALPVPVPRDAAPESPVVELTPVAEQKQALAANWEKWFDRLMEELSELDRHMLTKKLQRVMLRETSRVEDSKA